MLTTEAMIADSPDEKGDGGMGGMGGGMGGMGMGMEKAPLLTKEGRHRFGDGVVLYILRRASPACYELGFSSRVNRKASSSNRRSLSNLGWLDV